MAAMTYAAARSAFLERLDGARHSPIPHPLQGPDGALFLDAAFWPGRHPERVLVISSGTHGIEGYAGSHIQCALLDDGLGYRAPGDCSLLMLHAVNPWGFAWQRRVNEHNVDLNRNFIDHSRPHPNNPGYEELADVLEPAIWRDDTEDAINAALAAGARRHADNPRWVQEAVSGGQYRHPDGQFFGGVEPQWSNLTVRALAHEHLARREVVWIDIHTALGPWGTGQCIVELDPGADELARAQALWGERVGNIRTADAVAAEVAGTMVSGVEDAVGRPILGTGLEFGTVAPNEVLGALLQDQWLHRYASLDSDQGRATKQRMRDAFWPDDATWRDAVVEISREVVEAVLEGWRG